jgi:hypothetical protein
VSLNYPKQGETHPYLKPPGNAQFLPGYPTAMSTMPNVVIIGPWGKHDRELSMGVIQLTQPQFEADYETMIKTFQDMPTHPKILACLPIPIPFAMAAGPVNDVILPATKAVLARHPEIPVVDLWAPFVGHKELYLQDTGPKSGTHVTHPAGLQLIADTVYPIFKAALAGGVESPDGGAVATGTPDAGGPGPGGTGGSGGAGSGGGGSPGSGGAAAGGGSGNGQGGAGGAGGSSPGSSGGSPGAGGTAGGAGPGGKSGGCAYVPAGGRPSAIALVLLLIAAAGLLISRRRHS